MNGEKFKDHILKCGHELRAYQLIPGTGGRAPNPRPHHLPEALPPNTVAQGAMGASVC